MSKIQHLISCTMASGKFAKSIFKKGAAAGAWFASGFIDLCTYHPYPTNQVAASYR